MRVEYDLIEALEMDAGSNEGNRVEYIDRGAFAGTGVIYSPATKGTVAGSLWMLSRDGKVEQRVFRCRGGTSFSPTSALARLWKSSQLVNRFNVWYEEEQWWRMVELFGDRFREAARKAGSTD
ncbi:MAG: hypothetical protein KDD69_11375 [Bdellovibrionales bacterium]|nr:hypothetical protein [Bdellovibrionales bacterium]